MKIPKEIHLLNTKIEIIIEENYYMQQEGYGGYYSRAENKIYIKKDMEEHEQEETLIHEFYHALFKMLGEYRLCDNEKLIDQMAKATHQAINTMKFNKEN